MRRKASKNNKKNQDSHQGVRSTLAARLKKSNDPTSDNSAKKHQNTEIEQTATKDNYHKDPQKKGDKMSQKITRRSIRNKETLQLPQKIAVLQSLIIPYTPPPGKQIESQEAFEAQELRTKGLTGSESTKKTHTDPQILSPLMHANSTNLIFVRNNKEHLIYLTRNYLVFIPSYNIASKTPSRVFKLPKMFESSNITNLIMNHNSSLIIFEVFKKKGVYWKFHQTRSQNSNQLDFEFKFINIQKEIAGNQSKQPYTLFDHNELNEHLYFFKVEKNTAVVIKSFNLATEHLSKNSIVLNLSEALASRLKANSLRNLILNSCVVFRRFLLVRFQSSASGSGLLKASIFDLQNSKKLILPKIYSKGSSKRLPGVYNRVMTINDSAVVIGRHAFFYKSRRFVSCPGLIASQIPVFDEIYGSQEVLSLKSGLQRGELNLKRADDCYLVWLGQSFGTRRRLTLSRFKQRVFLSPPPSAGSTAASARGIVRLKSKRDQSDAIISEYVKYATKVRVYSGLNTGGEEVEFTTLIKNQSKTERFSWFERIDSSTEAREQENRGNEGEESQDFLAVFFVEVVASKGYLFVKKSSFNTKTRALDSSVDIFAWDFSESLTTPKIYVMKTIGKILVVNESRVGGYQRYAGIYHFKPTLKGFHNRGEISSILDLKRVVSEAVEEDEEEKQVNGERLKDGLGRSPGQKEVTRKSFYLKRIIQAGESEKLFFLTQNEKGEEKVVIKLKFYQNRTSYDFYSYQDTGYTGDDEPGHQMPEEDNERPRFGRDRMNRARGTTDEMYFVDKGENKLFKVLINVQERVFKIYNTEDKTLEFRVSPKAGNGGEHHLNQNLLGAAKRISVFSVLENCIFLINFKVERCELQQDRTIGYQELRYNCCAIFGSSIVDLSELEPIITPSTDIQTIELNKATTVHVLGYNTSDGVVFNLVKNANTSKVKRRQIFDASQLSKNQLSSVEKRAFLIDHQEDMTLLLYSDLFSLKFLSFGQNSSGSSNSEIRVFERDLSALFWSVRIPIPASSSKSSLMRMVKDKVQKLLTLDEVYLNHLLEHHMEDLVAVLKGLDSSSAWRLFFWTNLILTGKCYQGWGLDGGSGFSIRIGSPELGEKFKQVVSRFNTDYDKQR